MNEDELGKFSWLNPPDFQFPREKEVQDKYNKDIGTNKQREFINSVRDKIEKYGLTIEVNGYPYYVQEPIKHSCLWYKGVFTPENVITYLNLHNIKYITFFENASEFKSIKSISHYHIFHY
tara:strand:+ start:1054 stop:1416 length:363 start_codon:yes stop_codon:yes gene_type:complete